MLLLFGLVYYIGVGGRFVKGRQGKSHSLDSLGSEQVLPAVVSSKSVDKCINRLSAGFCHAFCCASTAADCNAPVEKEEEEEEEFTIEDEICVSTCLGPRRYPEQFLCLTSDY